MSRMFKAFHPDMDWIERIARAFARRGHEQYADDPVTQVQHALQCAHLAEREDGRPDMVVAAFLHDVGHILHDEALPPDVEHDLHDHHEDRGFAVLRDHLGERVARLVQLHVDAKRYLCTVESGYIKTLSPTSQKSFRDQGGAMSDAERAAFEGDPHHADAVILRRWDDRAKDPGADTPTVDHYLDRVRRLAAES